jgi:hypothetical protein
MSGRKAPRREGALAAWSRGGPDLAECKNCPNLTTTMKAPDPTTARRAASRRHLLANATECRRRNIIIRVDSVNADRTIAYCSVEQRERGLLRRTYTQPELVWRAEQALAPLNGLGLLPLINVHLHSTRVASTAAHDRWSPFDWIERLRIWLGYPHSPVGIGGFPLTRDPFGLRLALRPAILH